MTQQHDNHVWMTVLGEGWAIQSIERDDAGRLAVIHFWRGYWPWLSSCSVDVSKIDWPTYCEHAVEMLEAEFG